MYTNLLPFAAYMRRMRAEVLRTIPGTPKTRKKLTQVQAQVHGGPQANVSALSSLSMKWRSKGFTVMHYNA